MTPQEKDLITQLLARLPEANEPKDPEADALIRDAVRQRADAPYFLVQTVLIQDMALAQAQQRIEELQRQLAAVQQQQQAPQQPTSFLGRALRGSAPATGPWGAPAAPAQQPSSVWSQSGGAPAGGAPAGSPFAAAAPGPMPWGAGGGGFLRQAAATAAGVAGGALLFQGIQSLFGPHYGNVLSGMPMQPGISETVINNYYSDQPGADSDLRQADYQQDDSNDAGGQDFADDQNFGNDDGGNFDV